MSRLRALRALISAREYAHIKRALTARFSCKLRYRLLTTKTPVLQLTLEIAEDELSQKDDEIAQLQADSLEGAAAVKKLGSVPIFGRLSTGRAGGRQHPFWLREWGYELLVLGVLPTAVPSVMTSSASVLLQWQQNVDVPNANFFRSLRRELTIVVETLAAYKLAKSLFVRQIGTDATSRKKLELLTSNVMITYPDGSVGPLIMSGAYIARGGTSELEANGVQSRSRSC